MKVKRPVVSIHLLACMPIPQCRAKDTCFGPVSDLTHQDKAKFRVLAGGRNGHKRGLASSDKGHARGLVGYRDSAIFVQNARINSLPPALP